MPDSTGKSRISVIDIARGIALVAMTIYHFAWDLSSFGFLLPGTINQTGWVVFARVIASSFLVLVGISLFLSHANGIRWHSFSRRLAMVTAAAAVISLATYFATPDAFIFFGILHAIALCSLLSLPFIFLPWWLVIAAAAGIFIGSEPLRSEMFSSPIWWWLGLSPITPASSDYVPLFPWLSAPLVGIALAKIMAKLNLFERLREVAQTSFANRSLGFIGRHSLIYYLLHQPVMLAGLWVFTAIAGPADQTPSFLAGCEKTCRQTSDPQFCIKFCSCTTNGLKQEKLFEPFFKGQVDLATNPKARKIIEQCSKR